MFGSLIISTFAVFNTLLCVVIFSELVQFILVNLTFHFLACFLKLSSSSNNTSFVSDSATPCTVADQVPLSMGVFRQEHWSGLPCPPPGDLPDPGIEHAVSALPASATWEALS